MLCRYLLQSTNKDQFTRKFLCFPGQYFDAETWLYQNYFRNYDSRLGRYVQSGSIGMHSGINNYGYVGLNLIVGLDVFGLISESEGGTKVECCKSGRIYKEIWKYYEAGLSLDVSESWVRMW